MTRKSLQQRHEDMLCELGNLGARSWRSRQIIERGADLATFFGILGFVRIESAINRATGSLMAWSIRRDRKHWKG